MNIIPHNTLKAQVKILENLDQIERNPQNILSYGAYLSPLQLEALRLYDIGLNVFPQPHGQKGGYPWKRLQYSRLHRDHHLYGIENLFAGQCNIAVMCGKTSDNLFVIDCESRRSFRFHLSQLRQQGIPIWASKTARGGHIYLQAINGEVHNIATGVLAETEIKGQRGYVLAPPSLHPSGKTYDWLYQEGDAIPRVDITKINWLKDINNKIIQLTCDAPSRYTPGLRLSQFHGVSSKTRDYLNNGHSIARGERNNRLFEAACDLAGNQYAQSEIMALLKQKALQSGLPENEAEATIMSAYKAPRSPSNANQTMGDWYYALLFLAKQSFSSLRKSSDRVVLMTLIERSRITYWHSKKKYFRASIREIASYSHLSTRTVNLSLKRLINNGWIQRGFRDEQSSSGTWMFTDYVLTQGQQIDLKTNTLELLAPWLDYSVLVFNSDLAERGALGHNGLFLYRMMVGLRHTMMPSAIVELTGLTLNQVNYGLAKLRRLSLVERTTHGWLAVPLSHKELATLSVELDASSSHERRTQLFQTERQLFLGRILYDARMKHEGDAFYHAQRHLLSTKFENSLWIEELLGDILVQEALLLGAIVLCEEGFVMEKRLE